MPIPLSILDKVGTNSKFKIQNSKLLWLFEFWSLDIVWNLVLVIWCFFCGVKAMGKKRIIKKTEEEILKEKEKIESRLKKEVSWEPLKEVRKGKIFISSTYNNTIMTLTDGRGNVICWRSAGNIGFKGTKKGTSFAASQVAKSLSDIAKKLKIKEIEVLIRGIGGGRETALRTLVNQGLEIRSVRDITPIPHNGCRPRKPRRV
ncbi:MAG: 30S ribosomal protein S11 [Patescibacteria group bacterium]|nr:30S ribosomal protein S11 [Patescibacteria group bacterium]